MGNKYFLIKILFFFFLFNPSRTLRLSFYFIFFRFFKKINFIGVQIKLDLQCCINFGFIEK